MNNENNLIHNILNAITTDKIILIILIAGAILLAIAIIKELFKIALFILLAAFIYAGFLAYSGQKIPSSKDEAIRHGNAQADWIKKEAGKMIRDFIK